MSHLWCGVLLLAIVTGCASTSQECSNIQTAHGYTLVGSSERVRFRDAVLLREYHGLIIAPMERLEDGKAEAPVRAGIRLTGGCQSEGGVLQRQIQAAHLLRVSGWGYFDKEWAVFVIDCLCVAERLADPTPAQLSRLMVP